MNIRSVINATQRGLKSNSPTLLSGIAIAGVATTGYLAARAAVKAHKIIREDRISREVILDRKDQLWHDTKLVWRCYIPAASSGIVTVGCIVGSTRISSRRSAAAQAAFVLSERAYNEYRNKVIEEIGEKKEADIKAKVAEDRVASNPPPSPEILITGPGNVLCCELYTGRYFASDMETLKKAQNSLNSYLLNHDQAALDDWYDMIGLQPTQFSSDVGWMTPKLMELDFSTVLTEDGRPCLAFEYNYVKPLYEGLME